MKTIILTALLLTTIISKSQTVVTGSIDRVQFNSDGETREINLKFIEVIHGFSDPNAPQSFFRVKNDDLEVDIAVYYTDYLGKEEFDWGYTFTVEAYDGDGKRCKVVYVIQKDEKIYYVLEYTDKSYYFFVDQITRFDKK